jgi:hypothetical protein
MTTTKAVLMAILLLGGVPAQVVAIGSPRYIEVTAGPDRVVLVARGVAAPIVVDAADWPGVRRAADDLQADIARVTGTTPDRVATPPVSAAQLLIVGTIGRSSIIDRLVRERKIDVQGVAGKWESFVLQTVDRPMPGVGSAIVIAGSDKRGTIYGIYDVSEQIGVSPWYWWADVVPDRKTALFVRSGRYAQGEPSVNYRGIFLNDEFPNLTRWVSKHYGDRPTPEGTAANYNSAFYARIFEVILRLKGNYLWPAMWNNAFAEDDPDNPRLADEYGIVMGSSHQEPMLRAQKEWDWHLKPAHGNWNYAAHPGVLTQFWREGVRARRAFESIFTIGLRGENDTEMVHGETENIALLEKIVAVQRRTLAEEVGPDETAVPQLWCLYKEVQNYYEAGLRVPDDVTLLWAEDNWGNVRRLPTAQERMRAGGAGVYYHFDYHGGPRSYQWINTNPLPKIWDQMTLAKQYGADRIWIVNVGHFKGYELPTEFFLDLAWNTARWTHANLREYTRLWAAREFGPADAAEAAVILDSYPKFNARRKPELLAPNTYSLTQHGEADRVVSEFTALAAKADDVYRRLPPHRRDAFYQLVLLPTLAAAQVNELYVAAGRNALYAAQGRASTNAMAARVRQLFKADQDLMAHFNKVFAGGKWDHFMDQPHLGYTSWRDPPVDSLDAIPLVERTVPEAASLGVAVDGSSLAWPGAAADPSLPAFDSISQRRHSVEVFNRGRAPFDLSVATSDDWIKVEDVPSHVEGDTRFWVSIDWAKAPPERNAGSISIAGAGQAVRVTVHAFNPEGITRKTVRGAAESEGFVSMEAVNFSGRYDAAGATWLTLEDYGHTAGGMRATAPVDAPAAEPGRNAPRLDYVMYLFTPGEITARLTLAPSLNVLPDRPIRIAVAIDDDAPRILTIVPAGYRAENRNRDWETAVSNNARVVESKHRVGAPGEHTLRVWMIDPNVILQKILVTTPAAAPQTTYLGPPPSYSNR